MAQCETCGNDYDKAFQVTANGKTHTYDSFECAIDALAPTCANCGIRIVGHGPRGQRQVLLLRPLRRAQGRQRTARPGELEAALAPRSALLSPLAGRGLG